MNRKQTMLLLSFASLVGLIGCGTTNGVNNNMVNTSSAQQASAGASSGTASGEATMISLANELKTDITANNSAGIKAIGPKLNDAWSSFENGVKAQYPGLYGKIESILGPTVAACGADPIDKQTLSTLDNQLIQSLGELTPSSTSAQSSSMGQMAMGDGDDVNEISIGKEVDTQGMKIHPVYFNPAVLYPPEKAGISPSKADVHLEVDIHATKTNNVGFAEGDWIPYLTVNYTLKNLNTDQETSGTLMPMSADDGPHYGANVKMLGSGKYDLSLSIQSPEGQNYLLHKTEGSVPGTFWTAPIKEEWQFPYMPKH